MTKEEFPDFRESPEYQAASKRVKAFSDETDKLKDKINQIRLKVSEKTADLAEIEVRVLLGEASEKDLTAANNAVLKMQEDLQTLERQIDIRNQAGARLNSALLEVEARIRVEANDWFYKEYCRRITRMAKALIELGKAQAEVRECYDEAVRQFPCRLEISGKVFYQAAGLSHMAINNLDIEPGKVHGEFKTWFDMAKERYGVKV